MKLFNFGIKVEEMKEMNEESKEENVGLQLNDAFSFLTCEEEGEGIYLLW